MASITSAALDEQIIALRRQVALGCRVLAMAGHGDLVWGHVAGRDPADRGVWMKANNLGLEEVSPDDVLLVERSGAVLEGAGGRHTEFPIHTEVMHARGDVGGVAHTHPDHAVALAAAGDELRPISHAANLFVPPALPRFTQTTDLITTPELGAAVAKCLGDHDALFLVNHGIVAAGPDVETAVVRAVILERACAVQLKVRAHNGWPTWTEPDEALSKRRNIYPDAHLRQVWEYLVRQLPNPLDD